MTVSVGAPHRRVPPLAAARGVAVAALLAGPTALAFASGGFFDSPRLVAGIAVWVLVALGAIACERPLPRSLAARLALGGMALLAAWTGLSLLWAPLVGPGLDDFQRLLLYLGALAAAFAFLRGEAPRRAVEPVLALGVLVVVGYGLSERLLPGLGELARSSSARGRLEQPLTYWNAMGGLAAIGLVLSARLAGDDRRADPMRSAAAAAIPVLALGVYLSFSRGALAALALGVVCLVALAPGRAQLNAVLAAACGGGLAVAAAAVFSGVEAPGPAGFDRGDGLAVLGALVLLAAGMAALQRALARRERGRRPAAPAGFGRSRAAFTAAMCALVVAWIALSVTGERSAGPTPSASRLATVESNRYDYWEAALGAFADHPAAGVGAAGWRVEWLARREIPGSARDAHSLLLETAAELGLIGLLLLGGAIAGVVLAARAVGRRDVRIVVGPAAALAAWALQAGLDWTWELPAVTLPAIVLAGSLAAAAEELAEIGRPA